MKNQHLAHCNKCRGVLLKNVDTARMEGGISFLIRCPHCGKDCAVDISVDKTPSITVE